MDDSIRRSLQLTKTEEEINPVVAFGFSPALAYRGHTCVYVCREQRHGNKENIAPLATPGHSGALSFLLNPTSTPGSMLK